eukprot:g4408.t1
MKRRKRSGEEEEEEEEWEPPASISVMYDRASSMGGMNSPTAGKRYDAELPRGKAPVQLYSLATPNGQKVSILLEELGIAYDAHVVRLAALEQFSSGFVEINPNSKIPAILDCSPAEGTSPIPVFESAACMLYLAEKYQRFIPVTPRARAECLSWICWQTSGQGPMSGNFGHFFVYAPAHAVDARDYGVARYGMEVQRLCSVLDHHLDGRRYICNDFYSIADMIILPWFEVLRKKGYTHHNGIGAATFLDMGQYTHINAWADRLLERPAVQRGLVVCRGAPKPWLSREKRFEKFRHLAKL